MDGWLSPHGKILIVYQLALEEYRFTEKSQSVEIEFSLLKIYKMSSQKNVRFITDSWLKFVMVFLTDPGQARGKPALTFGILVSLLGF